jgi:hypothetical protein
VLILYLEYEIGLHYLENNRKLTPIRIMNSASINGKNIVNSVGIFNDIVAMNNIFMEQ